MRKREKRIGKKEREKEREGKRWIEQKNKGEKEKTRLER